MFQRNKDIQIHVDSSIHSNLNQQWHKMEAVCVFMYNMRSCEPFYGQWNLRNVSCIICTRSLVKLIIIVLSNKNIEKVYKSFTKQKAISKAALTAQLTNTHPIELLSTIFSMEGQDVILSLQWNKIDIFLIRMQISLKWNTYVH